MIELFVLGFDPVFLDIIVTPLDNFNTKLSALPPIGEHVSNTNVKLVPGGNSLNVARILCKLSKKVYFFGNFDNSFAELITKSIPSLQKFSSSKNPSNYTIALQFSSGEIQMNSLTSFFSVKDLSIGSLVFLTYSRLVPFSNCGLNKQFPALFETFVDFFSQLDSFLNRKDVIQDLETIKSFVSSFSSQINFDISSDYNESFYDTLLNCKIPDLDNKIFYFDPSTLASFSAWEWLNQFLSERFGLLPGHKIISINEDEFSNMASNGIDFNAFLIHVNTYLVVHDSKQVIIYQETILSRQVVPVSSLNSLDIISSVGAGDSFNAGLFESFSKNFDITKACQSAIDVAQRFLTGKL